jgi:hypothetical protein
MRFTLGVRRQWRRGQMAATVGALLMGAAVMAAATPAFAKKLNVSPAVLGLGTVPSGTTATFTISATAKLSGTVSAPSGPGAASFTVSPGGSFKLKAGGSVTETVTLIGTASGPTGTATILVNSNKGNSEVTVTATVLVPPTPTPTPTGAAPTPTPSPKPTPPPGSRAKQPGNSIPVL